MLPDKTMCSIYVQLLKTESIITQICTNLSKRDKKAKIESMEDLGIPNNIVRMKGGFFTGCFIEWDCDVPFIPVDTTVNACGVSIFKLKIKKCSANDFRLLVEQARLLYNNFEWNFTNGNHFISLCKNETNELFLVIHASDNTYKYGKDGLYPYNSPWYEKNIQCFIEGDRYLRYIQGEIAEEFYLKYLQAEKANPIRNRNLCCNIFGEYCIEHEIYSPHYGMPNKNSIAIGCQWGREQMVMLTAPGKDIYVFKGDPNIKYPHGFGMKLRECTSGIEYKQLELFINGQIINGNASFIKSGEIENRYLEENIDKDFIGSFLGDKPCNILMRLHQIAAFTNSGFCIYQ